MLTRIMRIMAAVLGVMLAASFVSAQQPDVIVGTIPFPNHAWGKQTLAFDVNNTTTYLKFLTVETDISCEGSYVNPRRISRSQFIVLPEGTTTLTPQLEIPANYGSMKLWIRIYDVVDTLDDLSLGTQIFEQPFHIQFARPDAMIPYFQERISMPPAIGDHGFFDNEFARVFPFMLQEGKSVAEIAGLADTDTLFVNDLVRQLIDLRFLYERQGTLEIKAPLITLEIAKEGRALADRYADKLAGIITEQLPDRFRVIDSLTKAGALTGDSNNFYAGAQLIYRPYPLVTAVCLWRELGTQFVVGQGPFEVFNNTDPCHGDIRPYLYLTQGGDHFNGHQYYEAEASQSGVHIRFGDTIPRVDCEPGFEHSPKSREGAGWQFPQEYAAESFLIDTTTNLPVCRAILRTTEYVLMDAADDLKKMADSHDAGLYSAGLRYWFWDLTATLITDKLIEAGTIARLGNGQYRIIPKLK